MAAIRLNDDLAARVVAWHNRHPFARRITRAHVVSAGLVSFPFCVPPGAAALARILQGASSHALDAAARDFNGDVSGSSLRERAEARARRATASGDTVAAVIAPPAARSANKRSGSTGRRRGWQPVCSEDLLDPYTPHELARWALRHGSEERPGPAGAPVREFEVDARAAAAHRGAPVARLWLFTAAIDLGAQRVRVLVSPIHPRAVLGPRLFGRGRLGKVGAALAAGVAAVALAWVGGVHPLGGAKATLAPPPSAATAVAVKPTTPAVAAPRAASAPTLDPTEPAAAIVAAATGPHGEPATALPGPAHSHAHTQPQPQAHMQPQPHLQPHLQPNAASAAMSREAAAPAQRAPSAPRLSRTTLPHVVPFLGEPARLAAREASEEARAERARRSAAQATQLVPEVPAVPAPTALPDPSATATAPSPRVSPPRAAPAPAARAPATAWAVSTRSLRTRFESEQMLAALRDAAYREGHGSELKLEVLPAGEDWRAVGWPFATRADAERLRATLAARGLKTEVMQF